MLLQRLADSVLISSQTYFNFEYNQKPEILYEFDVRLIFKIMCGGQICHVLLIMTDHDQDASAAALIHRQQTLYGLFTQTKLSSIYRNKPLVTYTIRIVNRLEIMCDMCGI